MGLKLLMPVSLFYIAVWYILITAILCILLLWIVYIVYVRQKKVLKKMVLTKYEEEREKASQQKYEPPSIWTHIWLSPGTINKNDQLSTLFLQAKAFLQTHTAAPIAADISSLMAEWGLVNKVRWNGQIQLAIWTLQPTVWAWGNVNALYTTWILSGIEAIDTIPGLDEIRAVSKRIVTLKQAQLQKRGWATWSSNWTTMWRSWNWRWTRKTNTLELSQHPHEERDALAAALASLNTSLTPVTNLQHKNTGECIKQKTREKNGCKMQTV